MHVHAHAYAQVTPVCGSAGGVSELPGAGSIDVRGFPLLVLPSSRKCRRWCRQWCRRCCHANDGADTLPNPVARGPASGAGGGAGGGACGGAGGGAGGGADPLTVLPLVPRDQC